MVKKSVKGLILFIVVVIIAFMIGGYILNATFFGILTLIGWIVIVESIGPLKWLLTRSSKLIDVFICMFTILSMASYGLNITAALTVAGVGYTMFYAPYLRENRGVAGKRHKSSANYKNKFNAK